MIFPSKSWPVRRDSNPSLRGLYVRINDYSPRENVFANHLQTPALSPEFSLGDTVHLSSFVYCQLGEGE